MSKQINVLVSDDLYILIVKKAGKKQNETGEYCSISKIVSRIFIPAAEQYFKIDSENVSPPNVETISERRRHSESSIYEDDSQNETQDKIDSKQTVSAWDIMSV